VSRPGPARPMAAAVRAARGAGTPPSDALQHGNGPVLPRRYSAGGRLQVQSCSTNGALMAAGAGDNILFWDRRTGKPAASFSDTHAQDVTQLRFHPAAGSTTLVSGSEDGLIAVFDVAPALGEPPPPPPPP
jgi:WD40 repeat protein